MDKKTIYDKAEKAINQAFEVTKQSVKVVSEKAGEAAHLTKLMIEKASVEHKISKKFAALGSFVFEQAEDGQDSIELKDKTLKTMVSETKKLDEQLHSLEKQIEKERGGKR